jgi:hypothetical protein
MIRPNWTVVEANTIAHWLTGSQERQAQQVRSTLDMIGRYISTSGTEEQKVSYKKEYELIYKNLVGNPQPDKTETEVPSSVENKNGNNKVKEN